VEVIAGSNYGLIVISVKGIGDYRITCASKLWVQNDYPFFVSFL
jgi:hypothetical protein